MICAKCQLETPAEQMVADKCFACAGFEGIATTAPAPAEAEVVSVAPGEGEDAFGTRARAMRLAEANKFMPALSMERFTDRARRIMRLAEANAQKPFQINRISTLNILYGLMNEQSGVAGNVLRRLNVTLTHIHDRPIPEPDSVNVSYLSSPAEDALRHAIVDSHELGHNYIGTEHILLGLLRARDSIAYAILQSYGLTAEKVRAAIVEILGDCQLIRKEAVFQTLSKPATESLSSPIMTEETARELIDAISRIGETFGVACEAIRSIDWDALALAELNAMIDANRNSK